MQSSRFPELEKTPASRRQVRATYPVRSWGLAGKRSAERRRHCVSVGLVGHVGIVLDEPLEGAHALRSLQSRRRTIDFLSRKRTAPREAACEFARLAMTSASSLVLGSSPFQLDSSLRAEMSGDCAQAVLASSIATRTIARCMYLGSVARAAIAAVGRNGLRRLKRTRSSPT